MSTESRRLTPILSGHLFLESPRWHEGRIWVSDSYACRVYSAAPDGSDCRIEAEVPGQPGGLGWLPDGRLLVIAMEESLVLRQEPGGDLVVHADLSESAAGRLNDMVVSADGHAYVGSVGFDLVGGATLEPGAVTHVDPAGSIVGAVEDLFFPNGMAITQDNRLLVGESFGHAVASFAISGDGSLHDRRDFARFGPRPTSRAFPEFVPELSITPDGCTLDAEGALWVADPVHARVVRVMPGGEIVDTITGELSFFACELGGADGHTLFICAAPDFDEKARTATPESQLLAVRVAIPRGRG